MIVGVTAGYLGGNADEGLSLLANVFLAIPGLPLLIVLADYVPSAGSSIVLVATIIAITAWAYSARTLRAQTLSLRNRDFVEAARVSGERSLRIILVEVLPNLIPIVAASFLFTTLTAIGAYVAIAFLGLAGSPTSSPPGLWNWGEMLREGFANNAVRGGWWWWWAPPGLCVAAARHRPRSAQLRDRRVHQPAAAGRGSVAQGRATAGHRRPAEARHDPRGTQELEDATLGAERLASAPLANRALRQPDPDDIRARDPWALRGLRIRRRRGARGRGLRSRRCAAARCSASPARAAAARPPLPWPRSACCARPAVITGGEVLFHSRPLSGDGRAATIDMLAADEEELRSVRWSEIAVVLQSSLNALNPVITIGAQFDDLLRAPSASLGSRRPVEPARASCSTWSASTPTGCAAIPHELSGGMRQRAMIAMALALEPQVMILDEPTTALDVVTQREILEELMGLRDRLGFAALFITHDLSLLVELADEIAVMYAGRLMERAPAALALPRSAPALHLRAAQLLSADARASAPHGGYPGFTARPARPPARMRIPSALPVGDARAAARRCRSSADRRIGSRGRVLAASGTAQRPPELARAGSRRRRAALHRSSQSAERAV